MQKTITGKMPDLYHEHDEQFIDSMLSILNGEERAMVCNSYSKVFVSEMEKEQIEHKKKGRARKVCNARLRRYIKNKFDSNVFC